MTRIEASMHTSALAIAGLQGSGSNELGRSPVGLGGNGVHPITDEALAVIATGDQIRSLPAVPPSSGEVSRETRVERLLAETEATIAEVSGSPDIEVDRDFAYQTPNIQVRINLDTPAGPVVMHPKGLNSVIGGEMRATHHPPKIVFERHVEVVRKRIAKKEANRRRGERIEQEANDFALKIATFHEALGFYLADQLNSLDHASKIVGRIIAFVEQGDADAAEEILNTWKARSGMQAMDQIIEAYQSRRNKINGVHSKDGSEPEAKDHDQAEDQSLPLNVQNRRHNKQLAHGVRTGGKVLVRQDLFAKTKRRKR